MLAGQDSHLLKDAGLRDIDAADAPATGVPFLFRLIRKFCCATKTTSAFERVTEIPTTRTTRIKQHNAPIPLLPIGRAIAKQSVIRVIRMRRLIGYDKSTGRFVIDLTNFGRNEQGAILRFYGLLRRVPSREITHVDNPG